MQIEISTRHGHLSDASQERIKSKAEKLLKIFDRLTAISIVVDLEKSPICRVDMNVSAEHKHDFVAHDTSDSLMTSFDTVLHKMEQQLRKYKEKVQERHRTSDPQRHETALPEQEAEQE